MGHFLTFEEHQRRLSVYRKGDNDRVSAKELALTPAGYCKWRQAYGLPPNKPPRKVRKRLKQDHSAAYQPSPDAHIFKRMLRERFMPTQESAIGLPGVTVQTRIRYVDRAI